MKKKALANQPWKDPVWEPADASAIQALFRGDATDIQQRRAIHFIVNDLCALPYWPCDPDSARNTDLALGKHKVGHLIVRLSRLNIGKLLNHDEEN